MGDEAIPGYNERAWGIDLVSQINEYASASPGPIERAGGEESLGTADSYLFPDVLLFSERNRVLHGWELKFPDTPVTDTETIENAKRKAENLGASSFLIWNVRDAVLYEENDQDGWTRTHTWANVVEVDSREDVSRDDPAWQRALEQILEDLELFFEEGRLEPVPFAEVFGRGDFGDVILSHQQAVAESLQERAQTDRVFESRVNRWWRENRAEYRDEDSAWRALAKVNLFSWINRFVFSHYLGRFHEDARIAGSVEADATVDEVVALMDQIQEGHDFARIYESRLGDRTLPDTVWRDLLQVNDLLSEVDFDELPDEELRAVISNTVRESRRKAAGLFVTPPPIAHLLSRITVRDWTAEVLDPCCGTGTIVQSVLDEKRRAGVPAEEATESVWANDKFEFPSQITTMVLAEPETAGSVLKVSNVDVFDLQAGDTITFQDPWDGHDVPRDLPSFPTIISNLPFVQFEDFDEDNPGAREVNRWIEDRVGDQFDGRGDLFQYILPKLWQILDVDGRVGVNVSNAWLGAEWGEDFWRIVRQFFQLESVVISGAGRWFSGPDVVTTLLVLRKRETPGPPPEDEVVSWYVTNQPSQGWDSETVEELSDSIVLGEPAEGLLEANTYRTDEMRDLRSWGLNRGAFFADLDFWDALAPHLVPATQHFVIQRGKRRGWNELFYPQEPGNIEDRYLEPVLRSPSSVDGLHAEPDDRAFCCSASIETLNERDDDGALSWIQRFRGQESQGTPLPEKLDRADRHWYEMRPDTRADFIIPLNPYERLFVARCEEPLFVDQRLTRLEATGEVDLDLVHALMNSTPGLFYIEAMGFGRGLGALDLNTTGVREDLHLLDPAGVGSEDRDRIVEAFEPILARDIRPLEQELDDEDRRALDTAVLEAYGCSGLGSDIRESLETLFGIRKAAEEG